MGTYSVPVTALWSGTVVLNETNISLPVELKALWEEINYKQIHTWVINQTIYRKIKIKWDEEDVNEMGYRIFKSGVRVDLFGHICVKLVRKYQCIIP